VAATARWWNVGVVVILDEKSAHDVYTDLF
jgi:hypothetical protein